MPKLKFLKTLIFPRALQKLQNGVNFSFFSYLKFFCFSISVKERIKENKKIKVKKNIKKIFSWFLALC